MAGSATSVAWSGRWQDWTENALAGDRSDLVADAAPVAAESSLAPDLLDHFNGRRLHNRRGAQRVNAALSREYGDIRGGRTSVGYRLKADFDTKSITSEPCR